MQRVISRVHQIVTSGADATGAASASAALEGLAASASASAPLSAPLSSSSSSTQSPARSDAGPLAAPPPPPPPPRLPAAASPSPPLAKNKDIELAVERLQYATLLGERKKAVASLHELARSYAGTATPAAPGLGTSTPHHVALGLAAIPAVLHALLSDPRDTELMEAMLELLQAFVATSPATASAMLAAPPPPPPSGASHGSLRSAAAAAATASVSGTQLCLQLLQDPSPWIRGPTIALVKCLQEAQQKEFAASVLECKEGLRRLLEVVEDKREHIRDAALQVLVRMTEREKNVQQFLAFEDGFVRLFQIIEVEGLQEGSTVVSDCLQIINNMLRDNLMNQTLFRDLPYLATHLPQLLSLPASDQHDAHGSDASVAPSAQKFTQKKRTMKLVLQLVRFLVSGLYEGVQEGKLDELALREKARKAQDIGQVQSMITRQTELMGAIGDIVCCGNEELADLQLQGLDMIQLLCSGNGGNQIILVNLQTLSTRRSLLSELIKLDIAEEETPVGAAATNLLDVLFIKNESAKMAIFQLLNAPPPVDDADDQGGLEPPLPAGRMLLDALITNAEIVAGSKGKETRRTIRTCTISAWKACYRFASLIADSAYCKELALRVPSRFEDEDAQAVSGDLFITRCLRLLSSSVSTAPRSSLTFQIKIAVLTMLIQWCVKCTNAVRELVGSVATLSILVEVAGTQSSDNPSATSTSRDEDVQIRGLAAILLGCCLEYLVPVANEEKKLAGSEAPPSALPQLTRHKLLDLISKKVGLERFANTLVQFQQSPHVVSCARTATKHQRARALLPHHALFSPGADGDVDTDGYLFPLYDRSFIVQCRELVDTIQQRVLLTFTSTEEDSAMEASHMNAPSAASAYQDLIRMQDKQIQDLHRQVSDLQAQLESAQASPLTASATPLQPADQTAHEGCKRELEQLRTRHEHEKSELEQKLTAIVEQSAGMDSRLQGITRAFEQLEAEHAMCTNTLSGQGVSSSSMSASIPTDAMRKVMADLDREIADRRRLQDEQRQESQRRLELEKQLAHESHTAEMATLQLQREMEELRRAIAEKEEQLSEQNEMIDVFRQGQESAKRSATQLKLDLERVHQDLEAARALSHGPEEPVSSSDDRKHEAAAKDMYHLWEKERAKLREAKCELEQVQSAHSAALSQIQALETRLSEVEQDLHCNGDGLQVSAPSSHDDVEQLKRDYDLLLAKLDAVTLDKDAQIAQLSATVKQQLTDIEQLRLLFKEMEVAAAEATKRFADKDRTIDELTMQLTHDAELAKAQRRKAKATMTELEDEIARMFFEKTEMHRKSKASLKQAENEIARMFLDKVELEKQLAALQSTEHLEADEDATTSSSSDVYLGVTNGSRSPEPVLGRLPEDAEFGSQVELDEDTAFDDMFIVLASLEIQCNTFRECLEAARGEQAVVEAMQLSRKRGALVL